MGVLFGPRAEEARAVDAGWMVNDSFGRALAGAGTDVPSLRLIPMYAATRLLADQLAAAPLKAYQPRTDGAREALATQPLLLRAPQMYAWKHRAMTSLLLWGNAYGLVASRDSNGWPTQIAWLPPDKVQVEGDGVSRSKFSYSGAPLPFDDVVHIPAYSLPGRAAGVSPIGAFRLTVETGRSAEQYAADWYDGGGIPAAVLRNETQTLDAEQARTVKERLKATLRHGDPFVTGKDWTYETVGAPAADARFIETMKLTATQIAAVYGVPAEEIGGETGSSLTYSTVEMNQLKLNVQSVRPWAVRIEEAISALYAGRTYVRFGLDSGVRADLLTRYRAHEIALRMGLETNPEARALEERPPLSDDELAQWQQLYARMKAASAPTTGESDAPQ